MITRSSIAFWGFPGFIDSPTRYATLLHPLRFLVNSEQMDGSQKHYNKSHKVISIFWVWKTRQNMRNNLSEKWYRGCICFIYKCWMYSRTKVHVRRVFPLILLFLQTLFQQSLSSEGLSHVGLWDVLLVGLLVGPSVGRVGGVGGKVDLLEGLWVGSVGGVGGNSGGRFSGW